MCKCTFRSMSPVAASIHPAVWPNFVQQFITGCFFHSGGESWHTFFMILDQIVFTIVEKLHKMFPVSLIAAL